MRPITFIRSQIERAVASAGYTIHRSDCSRRVVLMAHHKIGLVVDIGAAGGSYGRALRKAGYSGRIISFEPLPKPFGLLKAAASKDHAWSIHEVALGAVREQRAINLAANSDSSSFRATLASLVSAAPHASFVGEVSVQVERLDDLIQIRPEDRAFLKVDVQGFEDEVLAGGKNALQSCVGVQLELSLQPLYEGSPTNLEMISAMKSYGFDLALIEPGFREPSTQRLLQMDGVFFRS